MSRDRDALLDIVQMIELISEHGPSDEQALTDDIVRRTATLHWLLIIGEAANRTSAELRQRRSEIPWRDIVAMRNLVAHGYDRVRLEIVWRVIHDDLPVLEPQIRAILEELE